MAEAKRRPVLVWIISVFYIFGSTLSLLVYSGIIHLPFTEDSFFRSAPMVDRILTILLLVVSLGAAIALFLLRRLALYLFAGAFVLRLLMTILHPPSQGLLAPAGLIMLASSLALPLVICLYSWALVRTETLT